MNQKEAIEELIGEVLDGTELTLAVDAYTLRETFEAGEATLECEVHDAKSGEKKTIEGRGVGIVDAFFHGLVDMYASPFPSLNTIRFADFSVRADLDTGRGEARSDSTAEVTLRVANSDGREYAFTDASPSITRSSVNVVRLAVEFFVNSERAFISVYRALQHAREENRADSVQRYTKQLTTLVEATSYSDVIEQIRKDLRS